MRLIFLIDILSINLLLKSRNYVIIRFLCKLKTLFEIMKTTILLFLSILLSTHLFGQTMPVANFDMPTEACEDDFISITDLSTGDVWSWSWTFGDGATSTLQNPNHIYSAPGTYNVTLTVTDTNQNSDTFSQTIVIYGKTPVQFIVSEISVCSNEPYVDLNEFVDLPGGAFYTELTGYIDGGILDVNQLSITNYPYTDLVDYNYTNEFGCTSSASSTVLINESPSATLSISNTTCGNTDGTIEALNIYSPNGSYYTYWNTGAQDVNAINNLSPGTYYYNLVDSLGCKFSDQADVSASDFSVTGTLTHPTCHDYSNGSIDIEVFGGTGNYSVLWSTGHSVEDLTNLEGGNYVVTITDDSGCQISKSFNLINPNEFLIDYYVNLPSCGSSNGSIGSFSSQGGSTPYTFQWSNGVTTQELNNIGQGYYEVTVTDANNCITEESYFVNTVESPYIYLDNKINSTCNLDNGSLDIYVSPAFGEQITSIVWSNGATTEDISSLSPGNYQVTVYQSNGCNSTFSWTIENKASSKPEICIVTVDTTTNTNLIVWQKEENNPENISHYNIYRETSNVGQYQKIDTVNRSSISVFNDVVASPENRSWRYKISAVNECGVESNLSESHKTIHLVTTDLGGGEKGISWDNYEGFEYNTYDVLRYTIDNGWEVIEDGFLYENTPYTTDIPPSETNLDYIIEVLPPGGSCTATYGKAQDYNAARSNKPSSIFNPGDGTGDPNNSLSKEENENYTVALYPNPSNGFFEIAVYHKNSFEQLDMQIVDLKGKLVYSNRLENGVNYIDLNNVESGVYFVKIKDENFVETLRVVVK